jgi:hypothetical protein
MSIFRFFKMYLCLAALIACFPCSEAAAGSKPVPFSARSGLELTRGAARIWTSDARLIYVENDEVVGPAGTAGRWGYLYYSETKRTARGYSVRDGKIIEASDLGFDFEAPPLPDYWIDSDEALIAAEQKAGRKYRSEYGGRMATMILIRGAFYDDKPDATTWAFLYTSDISPSLVVVVDASNGDVVRTWRG